ncbi:RICIN domain-containing protein [Streptomyces sp. NPDC048484]|uniref:RICIN domain-containing protein n=1 Tax=Streptomyces sp. NPDC048484 TaxID=3155146 RepID=UPI003436F2AB
MSAVRFFTAAFASLALVTGIGVSTATAAPAVDPIQTFRNVATGKCLDDSFGAGVRTHPCNYGPAQQWSVHAWNDGTRRLQNAATGRCLSLVGLASVGIATCNSSEEQSWFPFHDEYGRVAFENQASVRASCLDDSFEFGLRVIGCNYQGWQMWA